MTASFAPASQGRIALLGAPIEVGASRRGALMGPAGLRTAGLVGVLESLGYAVSDHGDILPRDLTPVDGPAPANARFYNEIAAWMRALSARAYELARSGDTPIFLGGDHSLSMGSVN
ncbi:MAG: arginase, partial [Hyphomicrobiales bacterium]